MGGSEGGEETVGAVDSAEDPDMEFYDEEPMVGGATRDEVVAIGNLLNRIIYGYTNDEENEDFKTAVITKLQSPIYNIYFNSIAIPSKQISKEINQSAYDELIELIKSINDASIELLNDNKYNNIKTALATSIKNEKGLDHYPSDDDIKKYLMEKNMDDLNYAFIITMGKLEIITDGFNFNKSNYTSQQLNSIGLILTYIYTTENVNCQNKYKKSKALATARAPASVPAPSEISDEFTRINDVMKAIICFLMNNRPDGVDADPDFNNTLCSNNDNIKNMYANINIVVAGKNFEEKDAIVSDITELIWTKYVQTIQSTMTNKTERSGPRKKKSFPISQSLAQESPSSTPSSTPPHTPPRTPKLAGPPP